MNLIEWLFRTEGFVPHGRCGGWDNALRTAFILSDALIAAVYILLPVLLLVAWRMHRGWLREIGGVLAQIPEGAALQQAGPLFLWFAAFITSCGVTHAMDVLGFWVPAYRVDALIRMITALISWSTFLVFINLLRPLGRFLWTVRTALVASLPGGSSN